MKRVYPLIVFCYLTFIGCQNKSAESYIVNSDDGCNFSVFVAYLYNQERLTVKLNNETILEAVGSDTTWKGSREVYFKYPSPIRKVSVVGTYEGRTTFRRTFKDTLVHVRRKTLIVTRVYPKVVRDTLKPYADVTVETVVRQIKLVNNQEYYKDTFVY